MKNQDHKMHQVRKANIKRKNLAKQGMTYFKKLSKEFKVKYAFSSIPSRLY